MNQDPEQLARSFIAQQLTSHSWIIQNKSVLFMDKSGILETTLNKKSTGYAELKNI